MSVSKKQSTSQNQPSVLGNSFAEFQELCLSILAQSDNCMESQQMFRAATTIPELVVAWQRFWAGVLHEVPSQVIEAFTKFYNIYGPEINRAGMYFNEAPADSNGMTILVGNATAPIAVYGRARVYIIGCGTVDAYDNVMVHCNHEDAVVNLHDNSNANMESGTCHAFDRSTLTARAGNHTTHDSATAYLSGGTLTTHGHLSITAYNDAVIHSFTHKKITLKDNAQLVIN